MAWLLAIALIMALEVTIAVFWPTGNDQGTSEDGTRGATLVYYWGGLHNLPLLARWLLCVLTVTVALPLLIVEKRATNRPIRDALVGALMDRGEWDAAALLMRAFDRMKGLLIPMLANTGAQSIFRAFEKTLTPHSWDIFFYPATPKELVGLGHDVKNQTAATEAATEAATQSGIDHGLSRDIASNVSHVLVENATDTSTAVDETQIADASGNTDEVNSLAHSELVTSQFNNAAAAVSNYQCEEEGECWLTSLSKDWTCCPYQPLWGWDILFIIYATAATFFAAWFLTSRDRRMQAKLEHAISLSESADPNAEMAQRTFVIEWEFTAMVGGVAAYVVGKTWNDVCVGRGGFAEDYKAEAPLAFAIIATLFSVVAAIMDANGYFDKLAAKIDGRGGGGAAGDGSKTGGLQMELVEKVAEPVYEPPVISDDDNGTKPP